ncbi:MAG: HD domain-containing phosphohydrolase, partial [Candidatus Baltobacteraceae bacterium]
DGHALTPVMMLTGVSDQTVQAAAMTAGATLYLEKPLAVRDFTAHLRRFTATSNQVPALSDGPAADHDRDTLVRLHRTVQARDAALAERMRRTGELAAAIANELRMPAEQIESLHAASLVYDLGMLSVPEDVLQANGPLSAKWTSVVRDHVRVGAAILSGHSTLFHAAESIARSHHERYDGTGYPDRLQAEEIPLFARIVAIADTYTALTSERPYRVEYPADRALIEIIGASGSAFDPTIVAALERIKDRVIENRLTA